MNDIPIKLLSFDEICNVLQSRYNACSMSDKFERPTKVIYGVHNVTCKNNRQNFKIGDKIEFKDDDLIMLNMTKLKNAAFTLYIATLCHEMIHYFDRLYGEYSTFIQAWFLTNIEYDFHNTLTFERKRIEANNDYINVIQEVPKGQTPAQSTTEAVKLAIKALEESNGEISRQNEQTEIFHPGDNGVLITVY